MQSPSTAALARIATPNTLLPTVDRAIQCVMASPWMLLVCKLTIGLVSAVDIYFTIKYVESLPSMELNPIGRWLMSLDTCVECELQQVACFITVKFAGNFITLAVIELLCSWKRYIATSVAFAVACCQLLLLYFLICGGT